MSSSICSQARDSVLLVGDTKNAFSEVFAKSRIPVKHVSDVYACPDDLSQFAAVVICAPDRKTPQTISDALKGKLQAYVKSGGRALVEFAAGDLFGVELDDKPVFARHERIAVSDKLYGAKTLPIGTLLDEQYSYVLPAKRLPDGAKRILDYGEYVGTYRVRPVPTRYYEFWVDLGRPTAISSASQRYGGQNQHYCPDSVELLVGPDAANMKRVGHYAGPWDKFQTAEFSFPTTDARYVLFRCSRGDTGPGEYWFFAGEIAVNSPDGANVALHKKTRVLTPVHEQPWGQSRLTDGVIDGVFTDGHSIMLGAVGSDFSTAKWPALIRAPYGRGVAYVLTTKLSDWSEHHYRPTAKWEAAIRGICMELLPDNLRKRAAVYYVPLAAHTEPRRWVQPGEKTKLVVETSPTATVAALAPGLTIGAFKQVTLGKWEAAVSGPPGEYVIGVSAKTRTGQASQQVKFLVADRKTAYDRAIRKNMNWFLESGIMPKRDGSAGVHSTIFVPSPDEGPAENLPGPIRTDNLAMVIDAFLRFQELTGDAAWLDRSRKLGDMLISVQQTDLSKASYGSFAWVLAADGKVVDSHIWFHDNESRVIAGLLDLYVHSRDAKYLQSALRSLELAMDVSREDYTIGNHSTGSAALDQMGRAAYRQLANYTLYHYDVMRWFWAYAATGDPEFHKAASTVARLYNSNHSSWLGEHVWPIGPYAIELLGDKSLAPAIDRHACEMLKDPDIARYGMKLLRGKGDYSLLYRNDCSINTDPEPLADLLYSGPMDLRRAWFAYKASGSKSALDLYTRLADFLVRIQLEDASPKVDGCWVRGFDVDLWEDFGAPYDPNYGPYHAYSGWMNSMISEGLAFYVLDKDAAQRELRPPRMSVKREGEAPAEPKQSSCNAFALYRDLWEQAKPYVAESRQSRPPDKVSSTNLALGKIYTIDPAPTTAKLGVLTDGIVDGQLSDGQSVTWQMPEIGQPFTASVTIDLGEAQNVAMIGARMGALNPDYNADAVSIEIGDSPDALKPVATTQAGPTVTWSVWKQFDPTPGRYVRLKYTKTRFKDAQDKLAVGEVTVLAARS